MNQKRKRNIRELDRKVAGLSSAEWAIASPEDELIVAFPFVRPLSFYYEVRRFIDGAVCGAVLGNKRSVFDPASIVARIEIKGIFTDVYVLENLESPGELIFTKQGVEWGKVCCVEYGGGPTFPLFRYARSWTIMFNGIDYGMVKRGLFVGKRGLLWHYDNNTYPINLGAIGRHGKVRRSLWPEPRPPGIPWDISIAVVILFRCMLFQNDKGSE